MNRKKIVRIITAALAAVMIVSTGASISVIDDNYAITASAQSELKLDKSALSLGLGEKFTLTSNTPSVVWRTSNSSILQVTQKGKVTAVGCGTAWITIRSESGEETSCKITVREAPEKVSFSESSIVMAVGEKGSVSAVIPQNTASASRIYKCNDPAILEMTKSYWTGEFTALKEGTTKVRVILYNGVKASIKVTVKKAPEKVTVSKSSLTLGVGESSTLSCKLPEGTVSNSIVFRTSNPSVIRMDKTNGSAKFTAVGPGTAWVTVRLFNGKEASCKITVREAPTRISLTKGILTLTLGQKYSLGSYLNSGAAAMQRTYRSSNSNVVKMTRTDWQGDFVAKEPGVAYVTVRTYNGKEASCKVIVSDADYSFDLPQNPIVLDPGDTYRISSDRGTIAGCRTEDNTVATVSDAGLVQAIAPGTTDVIVTTASGDKARAEIIVLGNKGFCTYPDTYIVNGILNSAKLVPMKTNCTLVDELADGIIAKNVSSNMSNAQKAYALYDYLAVNCRYGYGGYKAIDAGSYQYDSDKEIVEFSYCILKNRIGTCENFSSAYVVLLRRLGFDANLIYGDVGMSAGGYGGHYWVDVNVNGKHYSFDPQVENNNLTSSSPMHFFYGMCPESNYHLYHYKEVIPVHGFQR